MPQTCNSDILRSKNLENGALISKGAKWNLNGSQEIRRGAKGRSVSTNDIIAGTSARFGDLDCQVKELFVIIAGEDTGPLSAKVNGVSMVGQA